jgi:molecular chaperone IbpA
MFDEIMRSQNGHNQTNYPPHNIIKRTEDEYDIEIAVAGFKQGDIEITVDNRALTITGSRKTVDDTQSEYLVRGISSRDFTRTFTLAEHVEVVGALVEDGILIINLERKIPDEKKPKSIAITYNK